MTNYKNTFWFITFIQSKVYIIYNEEDKINETGDLKYQVQF